MINTYLLPANHVHLSPNNNQLVLIAKYGAIQIKLPH